MNISSFIVSKREELEISQKKLAEMLHVSRSTITRWENRTLIPPMEYASSFSEIFKYDKKLIQKMIANTKLRKKHKGLATFVLSIVLSVITISTCFSTSLSYCFTITGWRIRDYTYLGKSFRYTPYECSNAFSKSLIIIFPLLVLFFNVFLIERKVRKKNTKLIKWILLMLNVLYIVAFTLIIVYSAKNLPNMLPQPYFV